VKLIPIIGSEINMQMDVVYRRLSEYIPHQCLLLNEPMKNHTSFRIGGPAAPSTRNPGLTSLHSSPPDA
jgi:hypothetical protein